MKQIEFGEDQLSNLQDIAARLFSDPQDPRSYGYRRVLVRPEINWVAVIAGCLLPPACCVGLCLLLIQCGFSVNLSILLSLAGLAIYMLRTLKQGLICVIKLYQRFAPAAIRNKCRFEPSCSQYMLLCLEKYGLCKGLGKGICRLRRCNIDHGGIDLP